MWRPTKPLPPTTSTVRGISPPWREATAPPLRGAMVDSRAGQRHVGLTQKRA